MDGEIKIYRNKWRCIASTLASVTLVIFFILAMFNTDSGATLSTSFSDEVIIPDFIIIVLKFIFGVISFSFALFSADIIWNDFFKNTPYIVINDNKFTIRLYFRQKTYFFKDLERVDLKTVQQGFITYERLFLWIATKKHTTSPRNISASNLTVSSNELKGLFRSRLV